MNLTPFESVVAGICTKLASVPRKWDGRACIEEMKEGGSRQWKQMEWIGWYLEYICQNALPEVLQMPGPRYGNVGFDGFGVVPWDFKSHATDGNRHEIIVNDSRAILAALADHEAIGLLIAVGRATYDDEQGSFKQWHETLKGRKSKYTCEREARGARSRRRKAAFDLEYIMLVEFTEQTLSKCGQFQTGFRNADGSPRAAKVLLSTQAIADETVATIVPL